MSGFLELVDRANQDAEQIATHLLGAPNRALSNSRSLRWGAHGSFTLTTTGANQGCWRDWSSGEFGDVADLVQREIGGDRQQAREWLTNYYGGTLQPIDHAKRDADRAAAAAHEEAERIARVQTAANIWRNSVPLQGTAGERYLVSRLAGVPVPEAVLQSDALRWNAGERFGNAIGAMVALMVDPVTGKPGGVHRTYVDASHGKVGRKMLGTKGVVRLHPNENVTTGLSIAEGIETALAASLMFDAVPIWAALDAGNMAGFPVLEGIEAIGIFADNDPEKRGRRAGQEAAQQCADCWIEQGKEATIRTPRREDHDFCGMLVNLRRGAAA